MRLKVKQYRAERRNEISHFLINLNVSTFVLLVSSSSSARHNLSLHHQNFSAASFINVSVLLYVPSKRRRLSYTRPVRAWDYSNQILIDEWILSSWELLANRANSIVILCRRASKRVQFHSFSFRRRQWLGGNGWNISTFDIDREWTHSGEMRWWFGKISRWNHLRTATHNDDSHIFNSGWNSIIKQILSINIHFEPFSSLTQGETFCEVECGSDDDTH